MKYHGKSQLGDITRCWSCVLVARFWERLPDSVGLCRMVVDEPVEMEGVCRSSTAETLTFDVVLTETRQHPQFHMLERGLRVSLTVSRRRAQSEGVWSMWNEEFRHAVFCGRADASTTWRVQHV